MQRRTTMRWATLTMACLAFFAGVTATSGFAQADTPSTGKSLITNGGFEVNADSDQWPDDWGKAPAGGSWEKEGDNRFLRLKPTEPGKMVLLYRPVDIPAGTKALELSWRQRISDLKPGKQAWFDARIMMDFRDAAKNKVNPGPPAPYARKSTDGWVERRVQFLVPEGAKVLELMPALFQVEAGTFDIDDIALKAADAAPLQEAADKAAAATREKQAKEAEARQTKAAAFLAAGGSLVGNGGFETDKNGDGWPDDWSRPKGSAWGDESGNRFLRMTSEKPGETIVLYRTFDIPRDAKALELTWRQRITDLKPGKEPWFDARIMMEFLDPAGKKLSQKPSPPYSRSNTNGWVERKAQFLVPENAVALEFMPALLEVEKGTFDIDDVALKPIDAAPLVAAAQARAEEERRANVPPEAPQPAKWPQELRVVGNQVLNKDGKPVWLQGLNVVSLEWTAQGEKVLLSARTAIEDWKANIVRLPVKEEYWFGRASGQKDGGAAYRTLVDNVVNLAANRGAYVLLDLHRYRAPQKEHAEFWKDAAAKYKNHPAVLFDLFNEPHSTTWEIWKDGGFVPDKNAPADEDAFLTPEEKAKAAKGFQAIGMQGLVNAVRETGARNVVVAGGLDWAYDLSGILKGFALDDKGGNGIIYASHIYPWKRDWMNKVFVVAEKHPVLVGEVGAPLKRMEFIPESAHEDPYTWVPDMLGFIQKHRLHWTGWSFHPGAAPMIITGWDYTPTPYWGAFAKRALAGEKFEMKRMR